MDRRGFTLIELLIFAAIFVVVMAGFIAMLVTAVRVQSQQSSANEVETQGQFLIQQFQYYIQAARLVNMTQDVATGTLQLRITTSTLDPTFITLASGTVYLQQGSGGALQPLSSNKVTVSNLSFTRHYNRNNSSTPYGTDSVSYLFTMAENASNTSQAYSQTFESSAALLKPVAKIALIQQASNVFYGTSTSLSATYGTNNATGSLLIAAVANANLVTLTMSTDTASNTWTLVASETYPAFGTELTLFAAPNANNSPDTVKANFSGSGAFNPALFTYEYRGAATSSSFDASAIATLVASTTLSSGNASPTSTVELLFGALTLNATSTVLPTSTYLYYRAITVTSTASVASGTNSNFPMLVSSTLATWETSSTSGGAGHIQNLCTAPNGGTEPCDLVFATSTTNCSSSPLNFETESYTSSTGALIDWVNVPTMQAGTVIYACYDDQAVTTDQSHPSSTWNSNYVGVWHLADINGTLNVKDSTANANNGTNNGATATSSGEIDGSGNFNGSSAYITGGTTNVPTGANQRTLSVWIQFPSGSLASSDHEPFNVGGNTGTGSRYGFDTYGGTVAGCAASDLLVIEAEGLNIIANFTVNTNWDYLTVTFPPGATQVGSSTLYLDGVPQTICSSVNGTLSSTSSTVSIGRIPTASSGYFPGLVEEARIVNVAFTPSWIATEYANQSSASTFYAMGGETGLATGGSTNSVTAGTGFTIESSSSVTNTFIEDQDLFITGPVAATWTTTPAATSTAILATFK